MSIIVTVEDREGELKGKVLEIRTLHRLFGQSRGSCLPCVSETEDAMFNSSQLQGLEQDIAALVPVAEDEKSELAQLQKMLGEARKKRGLYVKFYGEPEKQ